ncbi:hypothetical protein ABLN64_03725, partial [Mycobacterium tuberculosis]
LVLRSDIIWVFNQNGFHTRVSFRIYRETLSRFFVRRFQSYCPSNNWTRYGPGFGGIVRSIGFMTVETPCRA